MRLRTCLLLAAMVFPVGAAHAFTIKPIVDARLRYESVDQQGIARDADALTLRARLGAEATEGAFSLLLEGEGTLAVSEDYFSGVNRKTTLPIVADPENVELNRAQIQYRRKGFIFTGGRQRINLDDQRFVGSVAWRQNEQTFDAARVEWSPVKDVKLDVTYSWSARTIWGVDGGARGFVNRPQAMGGDDIFANASWKTPYGLLTGIYYRIDEDEPGVTLRRNSSATYGLRFAGSRPLSKAVKWNYIVSFARQQDIGTNPIDYAADYVLVEGGLDIGALKLGAGVEQLGSDRSVVTKATGAAFAGGFAFQTPFATLHKFQGWADKFLTTPAQGITDYYGSLGYGWKMVGPFDSIAATAVYHRFNSDVGGIHYGDEVNLQIMAKVRKYSLLVKYADYRRQGIASFAGDGDTRKLWLSVEWAF